MIITITLFDNDELLIPVAEKFTGIPGIYVPLCETVRGFRMILDGEMDAYPEAAFYNVGTIDDVKRRADELKKDERL